MRCGQSEDFAFDMQISGIQNQDGNAGAVSPQPLGQNGIQAKLSSPQLILFLFSPSPFHLSPQLHHHPVNGPGKVIRLKTDVIGREGFFQPHQFLGLGHHTAAKIALPEKWKRWSGIEDVCEPRVMVLQLKKPT